MAQFDAKIFNAEVFGKYLERIPHVKQNKLLEAGILRTRGELRTMLSDQSGGNYITVPMKGLLDGDPLNYDGGTDITADSTKTYSQSMVVVGRAKAWVEKDFSADITGVDFMDNVAQQVAAFWD
ncbi:MAG: phage coat protein, partial [Christensenellaceae bacterium]|nr:phage coat protein [Christensenellaceae bacterium]